MTKLFTDKLIDNSINLASLNTSIFSSSQSTAYGLDIVENSTNGSANLDSCTASAASINHGNGTVLDDAALCTVSPKAIALSSAAPMAPIAVGNDELTGLGTGEALLV